jgi:hypothetical protein
VKFRIWKSLTFFIGLILFIAAFGVILVAGSIFNPPPYRIVIALESIPPYTTLTGDMLAVDEQTMHQRVASRLVHEAEIEVYLGGMVIETIHAGEPLRRNAVVTADNPAAVRRLSLALTDPDMIAAVIPVSSKIIPDNVSVGDYVNVTMGLAGNVGSMASSSSSASPWGAPPSLTTPTPTPALTSTLPPTSTLRVPPGSLPLDEEVPEVAPPLDKIVLPHVQVIDVARERVPNPNYGMTFGQEGSQEPPFLEGNLESITLLVPKAAEELLYFAVDNGTLHISVVPHAAVLEGTSPSTGVLWEDVVRFFQEERLHALGVVTDTAISTVSPISPTATITGTPVLPVPATPVPAPGAEEGALPTPTAGTSVPSDGGTASLGSLSDYLVPLCIGGGLVIGLGAVGYVLIRRRKEQSR